MLHLFPVFQDILGKISTLIEVLGVNSLCYSTTELNLIKLWSWTDCVLFPGHYKLNIEADSKDLVILCFLMNMVKVDRDKKMFCLKLYG